MSDDKMPLYYIAEDLEREKKEKEKKQEPKVEKIILDPPASSAKKAESNGGDGLVKAGKAFFVVAVMLAALDFLSGMNTGVMNLQTTLYASTFLIAGCIMYCAGSLDNVRIETDEDSCWIRFPYNPAGFRISRQI